MKTVKTVSEQCQRPFTGLKPGVNEKGLWRKSFFCLRNLLFAVLVVTTVYSQTNPLPRQGLIALSSPDLSTLEESVREQVVAAQNSLSAAVKDPRITESALSEAYGKLGQTYHAYSLLAPARDCYLNASLLAPKDFRWIYLVAKLDHQDGHFDDAIRRYRMAQTLRPDYIAVPVNLGNIFLDLNRLDEAKENFKAALELDKNSPAAHYGLGQVALSMRNYPEAIRHFEATLTQVPSANRVHYSLAMAYRGLGEVEEVKAHMSQGGSVGVRVSDPLADGLQDLVAGERVHLARGKLAFEARRYVEAAEEFRKAVAAKPDSAAARINLGAALTQLRDSSGAIEQFEEALRIEPGTVNAHYNLAILLAGQDKHEIAIAHLQSALTREPKDASVRFLLGQELAKLGRLDEALMEFARVVEADPNHEGALLEQAKLLHQKGQFKQALEVLEKGHRQYPQKGRTVLVLSYMLATSPEFNLRNGARSLELAQRVYDVTHAPQHGALVALALAELGRCREAGEWQRRMISTAEAQKNPELAAKLRATLKLYEHSPCRPAADKSVTDLSHVL